MRRSLPAGRQRRSRPAAKAPFASRNELAEVCSEPDMTLRVADHMRHEGTSFVQENSDWLEKSLLIDRPDVPDKNAIAAVGAMGVQKTITNGKLNAFSQDQPAVAGFHGGLDYDCRPNFSGGRAVRNGSTSHTGRFNCGNIKKNRRARLNPSYLGPAFPIWLFPSVASGGPL